MIPVCGYIGVRRGKKQLLGCFSGSSLAVFVLLILSLSILALNNVFTGKGEHRGSCSETTVTSRCYVFVHVVTVSVQNLWFCSEVRGNGGRWKFSGS